jgi:hypothetical protein
VSQAATNKINISDEYPTSQVGELMRFSLFMLKGPTCASFLMQIYVLK